jgi:hypothetical protein
MSLQSAAQTLLATVLTGIQTAEQDVITLLSNPTVATFAPLIEHEIATVLTSYGVSTTTIEKLGTDLLGVLTPLLAQAAASAAPSTSAGAAS